MTAYLGLALLLAAPPAPPPKPADKPVAAAVETTLPTDGGKIRQFAFDGDPKTAFASKGGYKKDDHFTLRFDAPVRLEAVEVRTGGADGEGALAGGTLEVSPDGTTFEKLAAFADGTARGGPAKAARAVRVRPAAASDDPLVVREITVTSTPPVAVFRHPVEVVADASQAPELKEWAEATARECERRYDMICDELASDGYTPPTVIRMAIRPPGPGVPGVAAASGNRIVGNADYFKQHRADVGAMIHETAHCVQQYGRVPGGARNPGWLVEGVADYVRFFKYEPGKIGRIPPERARYDGSYRTTAAFLAFVAGKYDPDLVRKLNARMRAGKYADGVWKELTGKTAEELGQEWRQSLAE
jgi:hypothetical protein